MHRIPHPLAAALLALLTGCANLAPRYERPEAPLPPAFDASPASTAAAAPADLPWTDFITDERLRRVVALALQHNHDLRVALLNVEQARAQYRITDSASRPSVGADATASRQRSLPGGGGEAGVKSQYGVDLGFNNFELDFFGRLRNQSDAALENFFAVEENRRGAQISLVAEVANAWLTLAADGQRLRLAQETLASQRAAYELRRRSFELGAVSGLTLAQAQTSVESARLDAARYASQRALDRHALDLLLGGPLAEELLPDDGASADASRLVDVPAGLPSEVLRRRPDVLAAEHALKASHADIGAARAAFFPSITLTASAGTASASLAELFSGGVWSFAPRLNLPLFDAGRNRARLQAAEAQREIDIARYEKTLQVAFREVADALSQRQGLGEQLAAQADLVEASARSYELSEALFRNGASSYLEVLDAQRSLYAAQQASISLRLSEQTSRIVLYKALGGGWQDGAP